MATASDKPKSKNITLTDVRCAFPHLFVAKAATSEPDARKRFSITVLIPKDTEAGKAQYKLVNDQINAIKKEKPKAKFKASRICLKDGDTDETAKPEYAGHWFININRAESQGGGNDEKGLQVVDRKKNKITSQKTIYGGCWVSVVFGVYYTDKGGDAIPAGLEIVQFRKDDDAFGNGSSASLSDLPDLEDDEDDNLDADEDLDLGGDLGDDD